MPYYKIHCIAAHLPDYQHIKSLVSQTAKLIMSRGGVVRDIASHRTRVLPQRMHKDKTWHTVGDYWSVQFDASPTLMRAVNNQLRTDPRVLRWTTLKLGEKLSEVCRTREKTRATIMSFTAGTENYPSPYSSGYHYPSSAHTGSTSDILNETLASTINAFAAGEGRRAAQQAVMDEGVIGEEEQREQEQEQEESVPVTGSFLFPDPFDAPKNAGNYMGTLPQDRRQELMKRLSESARAKPAAAEPAPQKQEKGWNRGSWLGKKED